MQDDGILVSFVVPVYNVEKYLNECLYSIFDTSADISQYEVIAVNDGSTDNSPAILEEYKKYDNFRVISRNNQGSSVARNTGMESARGKYIFFVDSDDYLRLAVINTTPVSIILACAATSDCDIIDFDYVNLCEETGKFVVVPTRRDLRLGVEEGRLVFPNSIRVAVWSRLFRRAFLLEHRLRFYPGIINQDLEWTPRCFFAAEKVDYCPIPLYVYRTRPNSVMTAKIGKKECLHPLVVAGLLAEFLDTIEPSPKNSPFRLRLKDIIFYNVRTSLRQMYRYVPICERQEILEKLKECRHLFALAKSTKGKLRYYLTRWLPAEIAFRIYDI